MKQLKRLGKREGKSLGRLVSDLLAESLNRHKAQEPQRLSFQWICRPMGARIDLADKDALQDALNAEGR